MTSVNGAHGNLVLAQRLSMFQMWFKKKKNLNFQHSHFLQDTDDIYSKHAH